VQDIDNSQGFVLYNIRVAEFSEVKGVIMPRPDFDAKLKLLDEASVLLKFGHKLADCKETLN
jgi:hypothetical protein